MGHTSIETFSVNIPESLERAGEQSFCYLVGREVMGQKPSQLCLRCIASQDVDKQREELPAIVRAPRRHHEQMRIQFRYCACADQVIAIVASFLNLSAHG